MQKRFELTPEQRKEFDRRGVVRLPGFYPRDDIALMADRLWRDLERRFGIIRDRPETWTVAQPAHFQSLKRSGAFDALCSTKMADLVDAVLGTGAWLEPAPWGPLVTFPTAEPFAPRPPWHLDVGGEPLDPMSVLRLFTFLEPTLPNGGGTLYVAGSHLLAIEIERDHGQVVRSAYVRDRLKAEHPWFANLFAAQSDCVRELMNVDAEVAGHTVRLEEMTGDPGDVVMMHAALLHATAHNASDRPRMMLTGWIPRRGEATS